METHDITWYKDQIRAMARQPVVSLTAWRRTRALYWAPVIAEELALFMALDFLDESIDDVAFNQK